MAVFKVYSDDGGTSWEEVFDSSNITDENYLISPHLKLETNKAGTFEFMLNKGHLQYDGFSEIKTFVWLFRDDKCIFRGRVNDIVTDIFGQRTISCEGDLVVLSDSIQSPNTFIDVQTVGTTKKKKNVKRTSVQTTEMRAEVFFRSVIETHNAQFDDARKQFEVGTVNASKKDEFGKFDLTSYSDTSSVLSSEILGKFGGIIQTRYDRNSSKTYIDWIENYTEQNSQEAKFGVNLLELDEQPPDDKPWSILLPIGKDGLTISGASGSESMSGISRDGIYLKISSAVSKYGKIVHYEKFDDATKADDLLHKAYEYLWVRKKVYPKNITFKAIDLQLLGESNDPLELGDLIRVNAQNTLLINSVLPCIEMELDILDPENNTYTIGSIMPPDPYNKGKETLTSQHSSRSKSTSAKVNYLSDEIDGLQRDVDTLGNNININAENIKAVAKDIAVVAENLTIAAQNIAITANTIDIKAQELTATFEDEIGDAKTMISVTKDGIITEVNKKLYGENQDGTGGIVYDYNHQISITADQTEDKLVKTIYKGSNGSGTTTNPAEGTILATYTAHMIRSPEVFNQSYTAKLLYRGADGTGTIDNPAANTIVKKYGSDITQRADKIELAVWGKDAQGNLNTKSKIEINDDNIKLRVKSDEVISSINQTAETIKISASKVQLEGYVTADDLFATNGAFTNLTSGRTVASQLTANTLFAKQRLSVGSDEDTGSATFYFNGSQVQKRNVNLIGSTVLATVLATGTGNISLAHSHDVSVSSNGTVTLGGTVAAGSGGSFRIADTKTYKDGVSAAQIAGANSVTVTSINQETNKRYIGGTNRILQVPVTATASNGKNLTETLNVFCTDAYNSVTVDSVVRRSGEPDSYDSTASYSTTVHLVATASNGATKNQDIVVYGTDAFNSGKNSVTISSIDRVSSTYDATTKNTTLRVSASASNNKSDYNDFIVSGYTPWSAGYGSGQDSVYVGSVACYSSTLNSDRKTQTLDLTITLKENVDGNDLRSTVEQLSVGAYDVYNAGYDDGGDYALNNSVNTNHIQITGVTVNRQGTATVNVKFKRAGESDGWSGNVAISVPADNVTDNHS